MTPLTSRLNAAWKQTVVKNNVMNEFEAAVDDPAGRWSKGDRIVYGVKYLAEQFVYYAHNLNQACDIQGATAQKYVHSKDTVSYLCRLNSYRALRPGAGTQRLGRQPDIPGEPHLCRFHCQDSTYPISLLRRTPLLRVPLQHFTWNAYYNVAPLEPAGHLLWIPAEPNEAQPRKAQSKEPPPKETDPRTRESHNPELPHRPQQLTPELIEDAVQLFGQLSDTVLFFNALHAGASVNHIHFQSVHQRQPFPVETAPTTTYKTYDVLDQYPVQATVFKPTQPVDPLVDYIVRLQTANIPFNVAMLSEKILVIARNGDNAIVSEFPGDGLASLGMCGVISTVNRSAFETVSAKLIESAFRKMVVPASQLIDNFS